MRGDESASGDSIGASGEAAADPRPPFLAVDRPKGPAEPTVAPRRSLAKSRTSADTWTYDGPVPNESEQERLTQLLSPPDADEPGGEDRDVASLVKLITSQQEDEAVLSELIRRAVPASSE